MTIRINSALSLSLSLLYIYTYINIYIHIYIYTYIYICIYIYIYMFNIFYLLVHSIHMQYTFSILYLFNVSSVLCMHKYTYRYSHMCMQSKRNTVYLPGCQQSAKVFMITHAPRHMVHGQYIEIYKEILLYEYSVLRSFWFHLRIVLS